MLSDFAPKFEKEKNCVVNIRVTPLVSHQHKNAILSLGPHCAYFRMRKLKSQVAKVSTIQIISAISNVCPHI